MSIEFACKCGKQLWANVHQVGGQVQCPACGRAQTVPKPAPEQKQASRWRVDASADAAAKAELAGVTQADRATVIRLWSADELQQSLTVSGTLVCWYCQTDIPFEAQVFGRVGLAGSLITLGCPKCNARIWTGFSSHATAEGTDVFIYAPSNSRSDEHASAAPTLRIQEIVAAAPDSASPTEIEQIEKPLLDFEGALGRIAPYQEVSALASRLVERPMSAWQADRVCRRVQALLKKETATYLRAVLVEVLACLRDERAVRDVRDTLRRTLEQEEVTDETNLPLHDLCVLALLFGDGNGFLSAMRHGMKDLSITTRACKRGKRLTPQEIARLIRKGNHIDSYESTLGGANWQQIHPLLPLWVDEQELEKEQKGGWLNRLFKSSRKG
jgi:hypothetical protein